MHRPHADSIRATFVPLPTSSSRICLHPIKLQEANFTTRRSIRETYITVLFTLGDKFSRSDPFPRGICHSYRYNPTQHMYHPIPTTDPQICPPAIAIPGSPFRRSADSVSSSYCNPLMLFKSPGPCRLARLLGAYSLRYARLTLSIKQFFSSAIVGSTDAEIDEEAVYTMTTRFAYKVWAYSATKSPSLTWDFSSPLLLSSLARFFAFFESMQSPIGPLSDLFSSTQRLTEESTSDVHNYLTVPFVPFDNTYTPTDHNIWYTHCYDYKQYTANIKNEAEHSHEPSADTLSATTTVFDALPIPISMPSHVSFTHPLASSVPTSTDVSPLTQRYNTTLELSTTHTQYITNDQRKSAAPADLSSPTTIVTQCVLVYAPRPPFESWSGCDSPSYAATLDADEHGAVVRWAVVDDLMSCPASLELTRREELAAVLVDVNHCAPACVFIPPSLLSPPLSSPFAASPVPSISSCLPLPTPRFTTRFLNESATDASNGVFTIFDVARLFSRWYARPVAGLAAKGGRGRW
ncbi:hypothetical protein CCMSSC00406_0007292 [Pleurotus cornucopiae]|uniref:Uncharacterized protein n=1 Tax=Pleurotus cornucopiae TaxID=5321 RepID=A0ACB7IJD5_PLECO|nr:hypothetical protein CCMSSC00406_0007292 [Pleurotus cornucopiae]